MAQPELFFSLVGKKTLDGDLSCKRHTLPDCQLIFAAGIWHIYSTVHYKEPIPKIQNTYFQKRTYSAS
jgi:hypothetical protein